MQRLTARQVEVLSLASRGLSNAEIASELFISSGTVKRHLSDAFLTLGARSRIEAINSARMLGQLAEDQKQSRHLGLVSG
ncbi:helix-turn-helix domain-containing protein [Agromyces larvae]|uniref:Helix-turn-helix transcriptional regulator n=1 Tax=Agromyces larvae TaxID=2929802 RepID=A0ABY4BX90_9MICO|nr:helix-turn-helix transcriptional regulator [Agromyces larvae]UOE43853.1 helix-turn-helix transcriptional regulator [Agromyces larvae]